MNYEIIKLDWHKRRSASNDKKRIVTNIEIENYTPEHNTFCKVKVNFEGDSETYVLIGRVIERDDGNYTIDSMDSKGNKVALRIL